MFFNPFPRAILRLALAFLAVATPLAARQSEPSKASGVFTFKSYGGDQGLTTLSVTVMTQDQTGFLWVGTEDGLFRYDGESFHRFGTKDGLADTYIYALAPAPDGSLWVLTKEGLARFQDGAFRVMPAATGLPKAENLLHNGSAMACDGQSRLWITTSEGLFEGGPSGFWRVKGLPDDVMSCVWINPLGGQVLTASFSGRLFRSKPEGGWEETRLPAPLDKNGVLAVVEDPEGRTWARGNGTLVRFARDWKEPPKDFSKAMNLLTIRDAFLSVDAKGRVWVPTQAGVGCFQGDTHHLLDESWGLPGNWANCALVDREGSLWVGSEGVHRALGRMLWTSSTRHQGLPSDTVWSVARTQGGLTWAGTQAGLVRSDPSGWRLVPETKGQAISAIAPDGRGGLWATGASTGAWHVAPSGQASWVAFPGPANVQIQAMSLGPDGTLWAAGGTGPLWRVPVDGSPEIERVGAFGDVSVQVFSVLATKAAVFVSTDHGLAVRERTGWRVLGAKDGLKSSNCQALAMTPSGDVWMSYGDTHGLSILRASEGHWAVVEKMVAVPALAQDSIVSMAFDAAGRLWLGTGHGVKCWNGQTCLRYGRGDGLPGEDADGNAIWADESSVWVGLSNGLARFDVAGLREAVPPPSVRILEVRDGGDRVLNLDGGLQAVRYPFRTMDFDFAALTFVDESRVHLQVRLQGFEDQWRDSKSRESRYTALPPGSYRFEVRAAVGDGPFGNSDTFDFRILAPWWRTWWFYGLCFLFGSVLVLASIRWRTAVLEGRNRQLEALVKARTLDLERANEQLQESSMLDALTGLKNRRYLGMNLPEEEGRVLRAIRTIQASGRQPQGEDLVFLLVDLDHFKVVNDEHGHAAGDAVLKLAAEAIRSATRDTDTVARWGGEEFLIVARRADRQTADVIARKILDEVKGREYPLPGGGALRLTCSIGFSAFPVLMGEPGAFGWEEVVEIADQCLYAAKRTGRDAFVGVYLEGSEVPADLAARLLSELPSLVAAGSLVLRTSIPAYRPLDWKRGH
ncbi:MAG: diguanylate cyclase [Acidobacteria bacterium]|nr:diguanylate cyclase [Acidobacteriota bacterium]